MSRDISESMEEVHEPIMKCDQCEKKQILIGKYAKLVKLLQKKLSRLGSTENIGFLGSNNTQILKLSKKTNEMKSIKSQNNEVKGENLSMTRQLLTISKLKARCMSKPVRIINDENSYYHKIQVKTAPGGFKKSTKIMKQTQYFEAIKLLQNNLQLKCDRIQALSNQLYSNKNSTMHMRQIIQQLLKCICSGQKQTNFQNKQPKQRKWQIISLLIQFLEYSEEERKQIFTADNSKNQIKHKIQIQKQKQNLDLMILR